MNNKLTFFILCLCILISSCTSFRKSIEPLNDYPHWHKRMEKFTAEFDSIKDGSIIFLGNSITEGFKVEKYFPDEHTVNRGIVSDHIDGVIKRLPVCLGEAKDVKLFLLIGVNDIGAHRSEKEIKFLYHQLVKEIVNNYDYELYLQSNLPTSPRWKNCPPEKIRNINKYIRKLAKRYKLTYIDIYPLFVGDAPDHCNDELFRDGLHPNAKGYEIWVDVLREYIGN